MISSTDFPCYVDIYDQEKVATKDLHKFNVDELRYFTNINAYMDWLVDVDAEPEPWESECKSDPDYDFYDYEEF